MPVAEIFLFPALERDVSQLSQGAGAAEGWAGGSAGGVTRGVRNKRKLPNRLLTHEQLFCHPLLANSVHSRASLAALPAQGIPAAPTAGMHALIPDQAKHGTLMPCAPQDVVSSEPIGVVWTLPQLWLLGCRGKGEVKGVQAAERPADNAQFQHLYNAKQCCRPYACKWSGSR